MARGGGSPISLFVRAKKHGRARVCRGHARGWHELEDEVVLGRNSNRQFKDLVGSMRLLSRGEQRSVDENRPPCLAKCPDALSEMLVVPHHEAPKSVKSTKRLLCFIASVFASQHDDGVLREPVGRAMELGKRLPREAGFRRTFEEVLGCVNRGT